jgi:hypothetical protein
MPTEFIGTSDDNYMTLLASTAPIFSTGDGLVGTSRKRETPFSTWRQSKASAQSDGRRTAFLPRLLAPKFD